MTSMKMKMKMMVVVILTTTMAIQRSFGWRNRGHLECTSAYLFIFSTKIVETSDEQNCLRTTISITTTLLYTSFCQTLNRTYCFYSLTGESILIFHFFYQECFYAFAISILSSLSLVLALCSIFLLLDSSLQFLFLCSLFRRPVFL